MPQSKAAPFLVPPVVAWALALLLVAAAPTPSSAASAERTKLRQVAGLHAVQFHLKEGAVEVLLPQDLGVGDTVSGSLLVHTAGPPGKKREKNRKKMARLGLRVGGLSRPAASTSFGPVAVCAAVAGSELPVLSCERSGDELSGEEHRIPVQLLNPRGKVMLEAWLPVAASPGPASAGFTYLPLGKAGEPMDIRGVFDGDVRTTRVTLEGHAAMPLAESPRRVVVRCPTTVLGLTRLELVEAGDSRSGPFRNLAVTVRFTKPALQAGERTILEVIVHGLEDLETALPLRVVSLTPDTAQLERGPSQALTIHPREVQGGGVYPWVGTLVGIQPAPIELELQLDGARPMAELRPANEGR